MLKRKGCGRQRIIEHLPVGDFACRRAATDICRRILPLYLQQQITFEEPRGPEDEHQIRRHTGRQWLTTVPATIFRPQALFDFHLRPSLRVELANLATRRPGYHRPTNAHSVAAVLVHSGASSKMRCPCRGAE